MEPLFWEIIRFFKQSPQALVHSLLEAREVTQDFMDFIVLHFYPSFMNASCSCKQPTNFFHFVFFLIQNELQDAQSFENVQSYSRITSMLLKSLMKTTSIDAFFGKFLSEISSSTIISESFILA